MSKVKQHSRFRIILFFLIIGAVLTLLVRAGYNEDWTGFKEFVDPQGQFSHPAKTLWDWMELLIIPLVLAAGAWWLSQSERTTEREIAADRLQEESLQSYLAVMTELLLEKNLRKSKENSEVRIIARSRTLTTVRRLDGIRKGIVIRFLYRAQLIQHRQGNQGSGVINLEEADMRHAYLPHVNLNKVSFGRGVGLHEATLDLADLSEANLCGTSLRKASLVGANLCNANLSQAALTDVNLNGANLTAAILCGANLTNADLTNADLSSADLKRAKVTEEQLTRVKSLAGATMPNGMKHD